MEFRNNLTILHNSNELPTNSSLDENPSAKLNADNAEETEYIEIYEEKVPLTGFPAREPLSQVQMIGIAGLGIFISAMIAFIGFYITKLVAMKRFGKY